MPKVYASTVVPASIDEVWGELRDFKYGVEVFDYVERVEIEDGEPPDKVGAVKNASLTAESVEDNPYIPADNTIRETLLALDDIEHKYRYEFTDVPYPVSNYVGTQECTAITDTDETLVEWWATFDVPDEHAAEVVEQQTALFEAGLERYVELFE